MTIFTKKSGTKFKKKIINVVYLNDFTFIINMLSFKNSLLKENKGGSELLCYIKTLTILQNYYYF